MSSNHLVHRSNGGSSVWALDGLPQAAARELEAWLDALAELTLDQWCDAGRASVRDGSMRGAAGEALAAVIDCHRLGVTAWYVRDLVSTAAYGARHQAEHASRKARRDLAVALAAAESAALSIAAKKWLSASDAAILRAPFDAGLDANPLSRRLLEVLRGHRRNAQRELTAATGSVVQRERSSLRFGDASPNRQPESDAADVGHVC